MTYQRTALDIANGRDPHPCITPGCNNLVEYDDEPWCFTHSPDSGSAVRGYSYRKEHSND